MYKWIPLAGEGHLECSVICWCVNWTGKKGIRRWVHLNFCLWTPLTVTVTGLEMGLWS